MGARSSHVAATLAATAVTVLLAGCTGDVDFENDSYTFREPATEYADESTVLVQDGAVTDVWISANDHASKNFGYTPQTPAWGQDVDESVETTVDGSTVTQCWFVGTDAEHCTEWVEVNKITSSRADRLAAWDGLPDGDYRFDSRSVWWEIESSHIVRIADGVVTTVSGEPSVGEGIPQDEWLTAHGNWVRYWIDGANEPVAVCYDNPDAYDEEGCTEWAALEK